MLVLHDHPGCVLCNHSYMRVQLKSLHGTTPSVPIVQPRDSMCDYKYDDRMLVKPTPTCIANKVGPTFENSSASTP